MKHATLSLLAVLTLGAAGCSAVKVYGGDGSGTPRPSDCAIEFLFQPPSRPYHALADLQSHVTSVPPGGAWLALRPKACELGADAVIVTRTQTLNLLDHMMVEGTAIAWTLTPAAPPAPAPTPPPAPPPAPKAAS